MLLSVKSCFSEKSQIQATVQGEETSKETRGTSNLALSLCYSFFLFIESCVCVCVLGIFSNIQIKMYSLTNPVSNINTLVVYEYCSHLVLLKLHCAGWDPVSLTDSSSYRWIVCFQRLAEDAAIAAKQQLCDTANSVSAHK